MGVGSSKLNRVKLAADLNEIDAALFGLGDHSDRHGQFAEAGVAALARAGLLHAPLQTALGGCELNNDAAVLLDVLCRIGRADLSLGRLFEGHVNAIHLLQTYGTSGQLNALRLEADQGRLSGVWNAQDRAGVRLERDSDGGRLIGRKIWASGAAHIRRPIITADVGDARGPLMVLPDVHEPHRADASSWRALGMRGSETGKVDFTDLRVTAEDIVGNPGDYYRSPYFAGGAWRVMAVQLGGLERLYESFRQQLADGERAGTPHYRALLADAAIALETARLWTHKAAQIAAGPETPADVDGFVNLARTAFERSALEVIQSAERGIGLNAFMEGNPIERLVRDLSTYLRQPAPDRAVALAVDWLLADPHFSAEGRPP